MSERDGGPANYSAPAFPTGPVVSLRDWFAGMALQGLLAEGKLPDVTSYYDAAAKEAYTLADAMLSARGGT